MSPIVRVPLTLLQRTRSPSLVTYVQRVASTPGRNRERTGLIFRQAAVAKEVLKQVYVVEKLAPPSLGQVTQTYANVYSNVQNMGFWRHLVESGEWKRYAIYGVEAYGIFTIGEMIGRRNIVGYGLDETKPAHE